MAGLFAMPEVWVGTGLVGAVLYLVLANRGRQKQFKDRLARVSRSQMKFTLMDEQSLRRKDPSAGSAFGQRIAAYSSIAKLRGRLEIAGMAITPQALLKRMLGLFLGTFFVVSLILGKSLLIGVLLSLIVSFGLPHLAIRRKIRKRQQMFLKLFPEAIDLIVRGLRAGLPVAESFNTVSREIPPPLGDMFAIIGQQTQLGLPLEKALTEAAEKIDLTEFNFFVTTIILQRETGGNLGEILGNLSEMLRQRHMMKLKIFALSSEARASAYIVGSLPFFVFGMLALVSPDYLNPFYADSRGNLALLSAIGIMMFGGTIMYRMTQLEI